MGAISTGELLTVIAASAAAVVAIINAIAAGWGRKALQLQADSIQADMVTRSDNAEKKLDQIHELADGNLSKVQANLKAVQEQLLTAVTRITDLESLLRDVVTTRRTSDQVRHGDDPKVPMRVEVVNTPLETVTALPKETP